jgi:protein-tyrosine-phosphatase
VRPATKTVLFLCTGNYYRSRFAEILFNSVAGKISLPWQAHSRGLALERGIHNVGPMAPSAIQTLQDLKIHAPEAWSRFPVAVTTGDLEQAARVVALREVEHRPLLLERFPGWAEKVEYWHVDDAPGVLAQVEQEVRDLVARILGGGQRQVRGVAEPGRNSSLPPASKPATKPSPSRLAGRRQVDEARG